MVEHGSPPPVGLEHAAILSARGVALLERSSDPNQRTPCRHGHVEGILSLPVVTAVGPPDPGAVLDMSRSQIHHAEFGAGGTAAIVRARFANGDVRSSEPPDVHVQATRAAARVIICPQPDQVTPPTSA